MSWPSFLRVTEGMLCMWCKHEEECVVLKCVVKSCCLDSSLILLNQEMSSHLMEGLYSCLNSAHFWSLVDD